MQAEDDAECLLNYLLTSCANCGQWKGTMANYAGEYNEKNVIHLSDVQWHNYLQHAVATVPSLATAKTTTKTIVKTTGKKLSFDQYLELLTDATQQYYLSNQLSQFRCSP